MRKPRMGVGLKILLAMLFLAFGGVGSACLLGFLSMEFMGRSALSGGRILGAAAIMDSKEALIAQSCENLHSIAIDQAYITNMKLERVAAQVNAAARVFGLAAAHGASSDAERLPMLLSNKAAEPEDVNAFSAFSIAPGADPVAAAADIKSLSRLHDIFKFMRYNNSQIKLLYVGTESGVIFKHPWMLTPSGYDHRQRSWYKEAFAQDDTHWSEPYIAASDNDLVISCAKSIIDQSGRKVGVAAADVSVEAVVREFIKSQNEHAGTAILIDSKGRVMAKEGMSKVSLAWNQKYNAENLFESKDQGLREMAAKMSRGESGTCRLVYDGEGSFAGFAPVASCGWSIAVVQHESKILAPALKAERSIAEQSARVEEGLRAYLFQRVRIFLLISVIVLLGVLVTATWLSKRITEPVLKLQAGVARIGAGDLDCSCDIKTGDELEELATTFNKMSKDLKDYIRDLKETTAAKQRIESDLKIASEIQMSMLPRVFPPFPDRKEIDIFACMEPAKEVGGDLYDFDFIDKNRLFICIGDVSGKGIPAALFMATAKTMLSGLALQGKSPDEILWETNNYLAKDNDACMFITVFCGILDLSNGLFVCSDGGHNPPLLLDPVKGTQEYLRAPKGIPLGSFPAEPGLYKSHAIKLVSGSTLFLYTDGVTEAMDESGALFGEKSLEDSIAAAKESAANCQGLVEAVRSAVLKHAAGAPQSDDITMLALKFQR